MNGLERQSKFIVYKRGHDFIKGIAGFGTNSHMAGLAVYVSTNGANLEELGPFGRTIPGGHLRFARVKLFNSAMLVTAKDAKIPLNELIRPSNAHLIVVKKIAEGVSEFFSVKVNKKGELCYFVPKNGNTYYSYVRNNGLVNAVQIENLLDDAQYLEVYEIEHVGSHCVDMSEFRRLSENMHRFNCKIEMLDEKACWDDLAKMRFRRRNGIYAGNRDPFKDHSLVPYYDEI